MMDTATKHSAGGLVPDTAEGSRMMDTPGYEKLADVRRRAYGQAAQGKGAINYLAGAVIALEAQATE